MVAGDVEVEAGAVKGGVYGVEEPNEETMSAKGSPGRVPRENRMSCPACWTVSHLVDCEDAMRATRWPVMRKAAVTVLGVGLGRTSRRQAQGRGQRTRRSGTRRVGRWLA